MRDLPELRRILQEERLLLLEFEEATQQMLLCDSDRLTELVAQRERLLDRVKELDGQLDIIFRESPDGELLSDAVSGRAAASLPKELEPVYGDAMQIRAVISRLKESDQQTELRLRLEQKKILDQIRASNQGAGAKAARFYSVGGSRRQGRGRFGNA